MKKLRVAILADYREEGWPSMDLVAEMITASLQGDGGVEAELIRPPMPTTAESLLGQRGRNADRLLGRFWHYPRYAATIRDRFDVFHIIDHSYSQLVHALPAPRCLVTCHDIDTFRPLLATNPESRPWWFRQMVGRTLSGMRIAGHVACVSQATADQVGANGWIAEDRLSVIPNGVSEEYFQPPNAEAELWLENWLQERGIAGKPLLLHVGSTISRKRIDVLIEVLAEVAKEYPEVQLLRVGSEFTPIQLEAIRKLNVTVRIHTFPFLNRVQLRVLYTKASLVLQPSSYEGFGLPVAEAQASGALVVASDIEVLREIGGASVFYCPVGNISRWSLQVIELLRLADENPGILKDRKAANAAWAKRLQWAKVANSLVSKYQYLKGLMD